jgi:phospholipid-binding lipoprotein MlaA
MKINLLFTILTLTLLTCCSSATDSRDPLEPVNRAIFEVNDIVYDYTLDPITLAYKDNVGEKTRTRVDNALSNLGRPLSIVNYLLQGELFNSLDTLAAFMLDTTVGLLGVFDVSTGAKIPQHENSGFDDTLASWGVGTGPYIVLPLLGPSSVRGTVGRSADYMLDPLRRMAVGSNNAIEKNVYDTASVTFTATKTVNDYSKIVDQSIAVRKNSIDPYAAVRGVYFNTTKNNDQSIADDPFAE